jgi:Sulfotransferase family
MFVFVIGTGRCGSTLVQELLCRHPEVGFLSNVEDRAPFLPASAGRFNSELYRRLPPSLTRKGRLRYAPSEGYRVLARSVSPMVTDSFRDLVAADAMPWVADRFRDFFSERARAQRKPVFLHKYTGWPRTGFVREVFPEARFINVTRDGRAVVASALRTNWWKGHMGPQAWQWGPLPSAYAADWEASGYSFPVLAARDLVPGDRWLDVRFEDVLADPDARFKEMLAFMGLEEHPALHAALARIALSADRQRAYRRQLDPASLALVERSLAGHLSAWGYDATPA